MTLFPMAEGNTWVYDAEIASYLGQKVLAQAEGEIIFKMSDVKQTPEGTQGIVTVTQGDTMMGQSTWVLNPSGLVQTTGGLKNVPFSVPEPTLKFPIDKNPLLTWSNSGEMPDGTTGTQTGRTEVTLAPQIDTAVTTVSGVSSTATSHFKTKTNEGVETTTTWFQPGVGIVRLVQSTRVGQRVNSTTIRLKSWTVQHS